MSRKLYIELDVDWEDYDDVSDELLLEDISEEWKDKDGVKLTLLPSTIVIPSTSGPTTVNLSKLVNALNDKCNCTKPWGVSGMCAVCGKILNIKS